MKHVRWFAILLGIVTFLFPLTALADTPGTVEGTSATNVSAWAASAASFQGWEFLVMIFLPLIVQFFKQHHWTDELTRAVLFAGCIVSAVIAAIAKGELTADSFNGPYLVASTLQCVVLAGAFYERVMKSSILAPLTALLGEKNDGPPKEVQRAGFKGQIPETPPPGPAA